MDIEKIEELVKQIVDEFDKEDYNDFCNLKEYGETENVLLYIAAQKFLEMRG